MTDFTIKFSQGFGKKLFFLSVISFIMGFPAQAKLFQNTYVSFEIPANWECKAFGTDWVCHSKLQEKRIEALITSTAKIAGPNDTRAQYLDYLKQPKTWSNRKREQITSKKITDAKDVFINKFPWVDGIHKNSEIKSYISRYVGTVCCDNSSSKLGILVVLSAHEKHYTTYSKEFIKTVKSLRVMDIEKAISKVRAAQATGSGADMASYLEGIFDESEADLEAGDGGKLLGLDMTQWGSLGLVALTGLVYFIIKKRKRKRRKSRKTRSRRKK